MRQILFHIPLNRPWNLGPLGEVPGFGFGLVLLIWSLYGGWYVYSQVRTNGWKLTRENMLKPIITWLFWAGMIAFGAPRLGNYLEVNGSAAFQPGIPVFGYGLMLFIGFTTAVMLAAWRAEKEGMSSELIWDLAILLFFCGIGGARLFYILQYPQEVFGGIPWPEWPVAALNLSRGGIVLYGSLLAGAAGYFSFCYFKKIRPLALADVIVPSVFVGIGFGRIGCLLNGCCYGRVTSLPWGIQFPKDGTAFYGLLQKHLIDESALCTPPLHPTQIYSAIDGFMIAAITAWYFRYRRRNGEVLAVALLIYPVTRFCIELLRADETGKFGTSLTISQWISIALFVVNIGYMIFLSQRPAVRDPLSTPSEPIGRLTAT